MDADAARASNADRRIARGRLASARRQGRIDSRDYRRRRQEVRRAESIVDLQTLLWDIPNDNPGRDHWRYGRWRGSVRDGRELEIQRVVGVLFLIGSLVATAGFVYMGIVLFNVWLK
ncbi:DUF1707 domain-containing protein [Glycomyces buryatensis]|uniref:DUF1707 domain-containing protein n=1 Tax=Glycomyces buryatensis TaxID=2570927 RepID=A0A4S8QIG0_9ACTN|nr:DUF1707 domain-containing protein [Glycomyces buryatensis]THV43541.1 DUF1707 domain-containing protein [Glycomyces buryatensis]